MSSARPDLSRELGVSHATAIVVGTVIGSGIFLVPSEMMQDAGSARLVYLAWIVGGLLSFFGALTYAELSAMRPEAGGEYVYCRDAYGPLWGFLYAWTWFIVAKPGSIATVVTGFVRILGTFAVFSFFTRAVITWPFTLNWGQLVAIGAVILISALNYIGIKKAGEFQLWFTLLKVLIIIGIAAVCFLWAGKAGSLANFSSTFSGARGGIAGFVAALVATLWAYDGWNDLTMVSGEVKNPERNLPIALVSGVAFVGLLYMLVNAGVLYVMPASQVAASARPASDAVALVIGKLGAGFVSAGMALSMLVTLNGTTMSGARVPYAVARDGYFFSKLATVHPTFRTPSTAIVVQAILAILLLLLGGNFRQLFSLTIFAEWLFYMIAGSTIFVFRIREPNAPRPYRMWGYPALPAVFVLVSAAFLVYTFRDNQPYSWYGVLLILAGVPIFLVFSRRRSARQRQSSASLPY